MNYINQYCQEIRTKNPFKDMSRGKIKQTIKKTNQQGETMKTLISALVVVTMLFFVSGCKDTGSVFNSPTTGNQPDKMEFTITGYADGLTGAPMGINQPYRHFEGTGQSTPGGQIQCTLDYLITSGNVYSGQFGFGSGVLIAENGDKLYAIKVQGSYTSDGVNLTFNASAVIAGGTGDFDNVMGTITYTGTMNQITRVTHTEWTGTFTHEKPFSGNFTAENVTVTGGSCAPGYTRRHAEGNGYAIHFGNCTAEVDHCINFSTGIFTNGNGTIKAADGDEITSTYYGYALPIPGTNTASTIMLCTITGGTGRFAGATGYLTVHGTQELPEGTANCSFDGVIDY